MHASWDSGPRRICNQVGDFETPTLSRSITRVHGRVVGQGRSHSIRWQRMVA